MWSNEKCITLIKRYEQEVVLWDPRHELYYNKNLKQDAWNRIAESLGVNSEEAKKIINTLLGSYRREKSREKKSLVTGSGADTRYVSKWFGYEYFYFLADKYDPHGNTDTMESEEFVFEPQQSQENPSFEPQQSQENPSFEPRQSQENPSFESQQSQENPSFEPRQSQANPSFEPQQSQENPSFSQSRPRRGNKRKIDPTLSEAMNILRKSSQQSEDPLTSYGLHVANELRRYDNITIANIKQAINNILYQAEFGYFTYNPAQRYSNYAASSSPSPRSVSRESDYIIPSPGPLPPPPPPPPTQPPTMSP